MIAIVVVAVAASVYQVREVPDAGAVKGRVTFAADLGRPEPLKVTRDHAVCGASQPNEVFEVSPRDRGLKNVVVYLAGVLSGKPFAAAPPRLEQKGCRYEPHVQVIAAGEVQIVNGDRTLHNVHAYFDPEGANRTLFNLAQPFQGQVLKKDLSRPGVVKLACDVHAWMSAWIVVRDNPYYAITGEDGRFELPGVPPGKHRLVVWHEGLGEAEREVVVEAKKTVALDVPVGTAP